MATEKTADIHGNLPIVGTTRRVTRNLVEKVPKRPRNPEPTLLSLKVMKPIIINCFFIVIFTLETKFHPSLSWPTPQYMHANANSRDLFLHFFYFRLSSRVLSPMKMDQN